MNIIQDVAKQRDFLEKIANQVLNIAHTYSNEVEVTVTQTIGINISTRYGDIESIECNDNTILEVVIFLKNRKGMAISNNLSKNAIINVVDSAVSIARYTSPDPFAGIADKELLAFQSVDLDLYHPVDLNIKLGVNLASMAEQTALKYDPRIVCTEGSKFNGHYTTKVFGNSHGMLQSYNSSQYSLFCSVIAESNGVMEQNYDYTLSRSFDDLRTAEWIGKECARKALAHLNSKKIRTMKSPVLFAAEIATSLFHHLALAVSGSNIYRKSTFLLNNLKQQIFPSWISIQELPHIPRGLGSVPFDEEGVQTWDHFIIKNGILNSWLLDSYSARQIGLKTTGNAGGIHNWNITHKDVNFSELIKNMDRGLIVTNLMGQGVNIATGDYSRGISGFWVENGYIQYPVNEITISGNLKEMYNNIIAIGNDIEIRDQIRCGSVLIDSMQIAGT